MIRLIFLLHDFLLFEILLMLLIVLQSHTVAYTLTNSRTRKTNSVKDVVLPILIRGFYFTVLATLVAMLVLDN